MPRRSLRPVFLVSGLMCLLVLLALLQYRWSGQVSEAERLRMQSNLQIAVDQFRQDFTHELLTAGTGLQADAAIVKTADWDALAQAQAEWLSSAAGAHLVSAVYLLIPAEQKNLQKLDAGQAKYLTIETPDALKTVIAHVGNSFPEHRPGPPRNSAWAMNGEGPYLIHAMTVPPDRVAHPEPGPPMDRRVGLQLIALDSEYLKTKLLPELAARHFAGPDGFVYQTQVFAASESRTPIYSSFSSSYPQSTPADLEADLIEMRFRPGDPERGTRDRRREGRGIPPYMARAFAMPLLVSDGIAPWKLSVRHRAGSVAAAVQTLRWRNLSVSFVILLVLGASMVILVRNTQRAQRLAELQMDFVAGVSHELRTPLAVISSAAENLTDGVVEAPGQVKQYGSLIRDESRRLSGMMEQILQFAAGQKRSAYKPVRLQPEELIAAALGLSQTALAEGGFTVERDTAPGLPPVSGESGALMQCLQNLISNAAKYSGDSRWIGIRATTDKGSVFITVEDRGIGIEPADLPHLFDAFYRAKSVRFAQIHGTGLGLNLARSFARDAGGEITVESTPGQGSRFTLRLPADVPGSAEPVRLVDQTV